MDRFKIEDLLENQKVGMEEMKAIRGGVIGDCGMSRISLTPENDRPPLGGNIFKLPPRFNLGFVGATPIEIP